MVDAFVEKELASPRASRESMEQCLSTFSRPDPITPSLHSRSVRVEDEGSGDRLVKIHVDQHRVIRSRARGIDDRDLKLDRLLDPVVVDAIDTDRLGLLRPPIQ